MCLPGLVILLFIGIPFYQGMKVFYLLQGAMFLSTTTTSVFFLRCKAHGPEPSMGRWMDIAVSASISSWATLSP